MKNIVIISGVTGMTGNELARQLLKQDYIVIGFDNFFASSVNSIKDIQKNKNFHFFEYDLNNEIKMNTLEEFIKSFKKSNLSFINCAAVVHTKHFYHIEETFTTNVLGMKAFLDMAVKLNAKKFINCSTSEVYSMESWIEGGVKESDPVVLATAENSQRTSYATGKLLTEFFLKDYVDKKKILGCSIRFANVYSHDELYPEHIIPYIIDTFKKGDTIKLLENSKENMRTFLNNYDSCSSVIALLETNSSLDGTIYNVGTQEEISIIDLVKLIADKMGKKSHKILFEGYRESDPKRRLLNTEKITTRTNWQPKISIDKGLDMCIQSKFYEK